MSRQLKTIDQETRKRVVQMRDTGSPVWEIVEDTALSPVEIRGVIEEDDPFLLLNRKRKPVEGLDVTARLRIREMHRAGSDPLSIGGILGFSHQIVRVVLKAWGEKPKKRVSPLPKPKRQRKPKTKAAPPPPPPPSEPPRQIVYYDLEMDPVRLLIADRKKGTTLAVLSARYGMSAASVVETITRHEGRFR